MIKDQKIKLNGKEIPHVREVSVRIETPTDKRGIYREPTIAATIVITRDASDFAIVDLFEMATNEDGRKNIMTSGNLEFHGDDIQDQYSFDLKKAFISHWSLNNPGETNAPTLETVEIKCGDIEFKAGGGGATFKLEDFN